MRRPCPFGGLCSLEALPARCVSFVGFMSGFLPTRPRVGFVGFMSGFPREHVVGAATGEAHLLKHFFRHEIIEVAQSGSVGHPGHSFQISIGYPALQSDEGKYSPLSFAKTQFGDPAFG